MFALEATAAAIQREVLERKVKATANTRALGEWTRVRHRKEVSVLLKNVKTARPNLRAVAADIILKASKVTLFCLSN